MRLLQYIKEEYAKTIGKEPYIYEIFKNPTAKELRSVGTKLLRFVLDVRKKDLYVWHYMYLHQKLANEMGFDYPSNNKYIYGESGKIEGGKLLDYDFYYVYGSMVKKLQSTVKWASTWFKDMDKHIKDVYGVDEAYETILRARFTTTSYEVFKNPTSKEIFTAADNTLQSARFIIDVEKKDIYIFDYRLLHVVVAKYLDFPYPTDENYIYGQGVSLAGNKFKDVEFFDYVVGNKSKEKVKTLGWAVKWFANLPGYIKKAYKTTLD